MIQTNQDIRIYCDRGRGETYDVTNIVFEDEMEIIAKIEINNKPVSIIINKEHGAVVGNNLDFYYAENYTNKIKQYVKNGGELFSVDSLDTIRDGGTIEIKTNQQKKFWVHLTKHSVHSSYPPKDDNLVDDDLLLEYLFEKLDTYIVRMEERVDRDKSLLSKMKTQRLYHNNLPF
jgi:archaellum component FlaF (FlaF/FlaG flagellin family)